MTRDEMKNKISMELQSPTTQQGFEIICKHLADLEEENKLAKSLLYCTVKSCDNCGNCNCENFQRQRKSVPCELYVSYQDRIKQLEEQIEKMRCCGNCSHRRYWGNELNCKLDLDKQFECDNNNKKYWEFREE